MPSFLRLTTRGMVIALGGVDDAAEAAGISSSSISAYQTFRIAPYGTLLKLDRLASQVPPGELRERIAAAHKEGADVIDAALNDRCPSRIGVEIAEGYAANVMMLLAINKGHMA